MCARDKGIRGIRTKTGLLRDDLDCDGRIVQKLSKRCGLKIVLGNIGRGAGQNWCARKNESARGASAQQDGRQKTSVTREKGAGQELAK